MATIEVRPLTAAIGAEVVGVDRREPLTDEQVALLRGARLDRLVLFFRGQRLGAEEHRALAQLPQ
jgi:taurine dioxygenase